VTVTKPSQAHVHVDESSSAATPLIVTRAEPGDHGAGSTGRHGGGTLEPAAGLDGDVQIPNGRTLAGVMSVTTPTGLPIDVWIPEAAKVAGSAPNEHCSVAPVHTKSGMNHPLYLTSSMFSL
jgi:hypothetical protein